MMEIQCLCFPVLFIGEIGSCFFALSLECPQCIRFFDPWKNKILRSWFLQGGEYGGHWSPLPVSPPIAWSVPANFPHVNSFLHSKASGVYTVQGKVSFCRTAHIQAIMQSKLQSYYDRIVYADEYKAKQYSHTLAISFSLLIYDHFSLCFHPFSSIFSVPFGSSNLLSLHPSRCTPRILCRP
jgi:hypothetical protein